MHKVVNHDSFRYAGYNVQHRKLWSLGAAASRNAQSFANAYGVCGTCGELIDLDEKTLGNMCEDCQMGRRAVYKGDVYLLPVLRAIDCECGGRFLPVGGIGIACERVKCSKCVKWFSILGFATYCRSMKVVFDFLGIGSRQNGLPPSCRSCGAMRWKVGQHGVKCLGCDGLSGIEPEQFAGRDNVWVDGFPDPLQSLVVALNLHRDGPGGCGEAIKESILTKLEQASTFPEAPFDPYQAARIVAIVESMTKIDVEVQGYVDSKGQSQFRVAKKGSARPGSGKNKYDDVIFSEETDLDKLEHKVRVNLDNRIATTKANIAAAQAQVTENTKYVEQYKSRLEVLKKAHEL